jgi:hypothetical protein
MSLSSLIVQREVATMRQVEEALARQVIYGGDLVTNLLEVARVDEGVLTRLLAESMQLPPAPAGELPVAESMRALIASELASQRSIVPIEVREGRLVLAVAEPIPREVEEQIAFSLGLQIEQRAATAVRVRHAISRLYGVPLERRIDRLIERLSGRSTSGTNSLAPPLGVVPEVARAAPAPTSTASGLASERQGLTTPAFGTAAIPLVRRAAPPSGGPVQRTQTAGGFPAMRGDDPPPSSAPATPVHVRPSPPSPPAPAPAPDAPALLQREAAASPRTARRRRGPLTVDAAKQEAEEASDRDALLDLFFDFSRQFFDYAALFLVHGDIAEGREAFGTGAAREKVLGMGIPLDLPSVVSTVREKKTTVVAKVGGEGLEGVLLADLQRPRDVEAAFVPLVVRTRAVAILVGDCGPGGIDRASVAQVTSFASDVGKAFERIIVRRKLDGFIAGGKGQAVGKVDVAAVSLKRPTAPTASTAPPRPGAGASPGRVSIPAAPPAPAPVTMPSVAPPSAPAPASSYRPARLTLSGSSVAPTSVAPTNTSLRPATSTVPPPSANIAAVRRISGPPIPREEPATPARGMPGARTSASPSPPDVVVLPEVREAPPVEVAAVDEELGPQIEATAITTISDAPEDIRTLFDELAWETRIEPDVPPPPPSSSIAVAPHLPPSPHPKDTPLPSVVVDLNEDLARLVDRVIAGDPEDQAEGELLRQGEKAMPVVMSRFPGPVTAERSRIATMARPPRASDCGPVLRLVARERKVALPFVLERLTDGDAETRGWATHLLCELAYSEAIPYLLLRLRDHDPSTRMSAALALAVIGRSSAREVRDAVLGLAHGVDPRERTAAMLAMAELRQPGLVPELVRALGDGDEAVVTAAHAALVQVTRQDFGADARPWLKWWEQHGGKHRVEWLIDALTHEVSEIRRWAGEELRSVTKEYFGYASDLPARDRERAKQRYRDWWITEGKARFAKAPPG